MYYNKLTRQTNNLSPCMQQSAYLQPLMSSSPTSSGTDISPVQGMGQLPTGIPLGPAQAPIPAPQPLPQTITQPITTGQAPQTVESTLFIPGFLKTQIGRRVRVEFLIGTNGTTDRTGILIGVGASYILLREPEEDNVIMADLYSIKFVTILL